MSRVSLDGRGRAFYEGMDESGCKVMETSEDWRTILEQQQKLPFALDKGELVRVFVAAASGEQSLVVMAHHLAGDGKSLVYFIEDVMRTLAGERLEYKPLQLLSPASLPDSSRLPLAYRLYAHLLNYRWNRSGRTFGWQDYEHIHQSCWPKRHSVVVCEAFSAEEVRGLQEFAKSARVSVNSWIAAALLEADPAARTLGLAVDARQDGNRSMSNQATGISITHPFSHRLTFFQNAQMIHRKVRLKLGKPGLKYLIVRFMPLLEPGLIDSILMYTHGLYRSPITQRLAERMGYAGNKTRELGLSNLTRLDIPAVYGAYGLKQAVFIPPVVSYARRIIGVCTMEDGMTITCHFMSDGRKEQEERAFFRRAMENMRKRQP